MDLPNTIRNRRIYVAGRRAPSGWGADDHGHNTTSISHASRIHSQNSLITCQQFKLSDMSFGLCSQAGINHDDNLFEIYVIYECSSQSHKAGVFCLLKIFAVCVCVSLCWSAVLRVTNDCTLTINVCVVFRMRVMVVNTWTKNTRRYGSLLLIITRTRRGKLCRTQTQPTGFDKIIDPRVIFSGVRIECVICFWGNLTCVFAKNKEELTIWNAADEQKRCLISVEGLARTIDSHAKCSTLWWRLDMGSLYRKYVDMLMWVNLLNSNLPKR